MATRKVTKSRNNHRYSQSSIQHNGLEELEGRVLFSAASLMTVLSGQTPANDGVLSIEANPGVVVDTPNDTHQPIAVRNGLVPTPEDGMIRVSPGEDMIDELSLAPSKINGSGGDGGEQEKDQEQEKAQDLKKDNIPPEDFGTDKIYGDTDGDDVNDRGVFGTDDEPGPDVLWVDKDGDGLVDQDELSPAPSKVNGPATNADRPVVIGDVDNDGNVNNLDLTPFIVALQLGGSVDDSNKIDPFNAQVPGGNFASADANADGLVNNLDITPIISLLAQPGVDANYSHAASKSVQQAEPLRAILATAAVRRVPRPYTDPLGDTGPFDTVVTVDLFAGL